MMGLPILTIRNPTCWDASTAFTAPPVRPSCRTNTTANTDSFLIERHEETIDDILSNSDCRAPGYRGAARNGGHRSRHIVGWLLHATRRARGLSQRLPRTPSDHPEGRRAHRRNFPRP